MDSFDVLSGVSILFAFVTGALFAKEFVGGRGCRQSFALLGDTEEGSRGYLAWRLRRGVPFVLPLARPALRIDWVSRMAKAAVRVVEAKGFSASEESLTSLAVVVLPVSGLAALIASGSMLCGCAAALSVAFGLAIWVRSNDEKRRVVLQECAPDALRAMSSCFSSGLSLLQTFRMLAQSGEEPVRLLFERSARVLETGGTTKEALAVLADSGLEELAFVSAALDVQHQAGGPMAPVLESAISAVEGELELVRSLRVQTAQAKLSARIVTMMPFALVTLFSLVSEEFLSPFFSSLEGIVLLLTALILQIAGIVSVRRMLRAEVVA